MRGFVPFQGAELSELWDALPPMDVVDREMVFVSLRTPESIEAAYAGKLECFWCELVGASPNATPVKQLFEGMRTLVDWPSVERWVKLIYEAKR